MLKSVRYPLMIDPQLSAITWLKRREGSKLLIGKMGDPELLKRVTDALEKGNLFLIENIGETIDSNLVPIVNRISIKRGAKKFVLINDEEVEVHQYFRLFLHTKLSNPHYQASMQSSTTIVNFSVTQDGLEEQLLSLSVRLERY